MKKIKRIGDNGDNVVFVYESDLDELEQQLELLKGKNKALQNVVDNYYTNSAVSMINDLREKLSIVARQRDEAVEIVVDYTRGLEDSGWNKGRWTRNIAFLEKLFPGQTWEEMKEGKR